MPLRPRTVDHLAVVVCTLAGAGLLVVEARGGASGARLVVDDVGGALACGALWWRRTRVLLVLALMVPIAVVSFSSSPASLVALYAGGRPWSASRSCWSR